MSVQIILILLAVAGAVGVAWAARSMNAPLMWAIANSASREPFTGSTWVAGSTATP